MLPIFCRKDGNWKKELEKYLDANEFVTLLALGEVRYEVLHHLLQREDIQILSLTTKKMKNKNKGLGLKIQVQQRVL